MNAADEETKKVNTQLKLSFLPVFVQGQLTLSNLEFASIITPGLRSVYF